MTQIINTHLIKYFLLKKYFISKINECGSMESKDRTRNNQDPKNKAIEAHLSLLKARIAKLIRDQVE